jgi:hypothetical protein
MEKNIIKLFLLLLTFALTNCSEETVTPADEHDPITTAQAYYGNSVFVIDLKTMPGDSANTWPVQLLVKGIPSKKISVNWGDGTIKKYTLDSTQYVTLKHQYDRIKNYSIRITGDIASVTEFRMAYSTVELQNIYTAGLTNLEELSLQLIAKAPNAINLSQNRKLKGVYLVGLDELSDLILPSTHQIKSIDISGPNNLSTQVVDRAVSRIYDSVVANPRAGYFDLSSHWGESNDGMVGPPSVYSINKLQKLEDVYGWRINPSISGE